MFSADNRSSPTSDNHATRDICYYHRRFGNAARKCKPLCTFTGNDGASEASQLNSLLVIVDDNSAKLFLVDNGASFRVFPASHKDRHSGVRTYSLVAANGSKIATHGSRTCLSQTGATWPVIIGDVRTPHLGAYFLQANALPVDIQSQRLINATSFATSSLQQSDEPTLRLHHITSDDTYRRILDAFPAIMRPVFVSPSVRDGVEHFIPTTGLPVYAKGRRLPPDELTVTKARVEHYGGNEHHRAI